jgi:hypothetical protein
VKLKHERKCLRLAAVRINSEDTSQFIRICCGWTFDINRGVERRAVAGAASGNGTRPIKWKGSQVAFLLIALGTFILVIGLE